MTGVPIIDFAAFRRGNTADRRVVARAVDEACRSIGFLVITGHGVPADLIAEVDAASRRFFDLPLATKMAVARPAPDVTRGYIALEGEAVARSRGDATPGDLNESFMIGPVDVPAGDPYFTAAAAGKHFAPNLWPAEPADLKPAYIAYFRAMAVLAADLMRSFALALALAPDFFDDKIDRHISRLRVRNYPAPTRPPEPGQLRAGAHSDYGSLTILRAEDRPGGLQAFDQTAGWLDVPVVPDCFIVNIGDLMAQWTNDAWVSTLHRVVNPPAERAADSRRQSLVFFHNPNYDAPVACLPSCCSADRPPKYLPTTSGAYLRDRFTATQIAMKPAYAD
jgi:isopenicillin N synthase-like dioxygenase